MGKSRLVLASAFAALLPCACLAHEARLLDLADLASPSFTVYTAEDGLSDEVWSNVGFDAQGFVWAGSASSLARFDGYAWTSEPFAAHSLVRDLALDGDGTLWALFESEGLARYDGRAWTRYDGSTRALHRFSSLPAPGGGSELWVGEAEGLLRVQDGRWVPDPANSARVGMPADVERTQSMFGGPREWLGATNGGLWFSEAGAKPGPWQRYSAPELDAMSATDLVRTVDHGVEELWFLSYGRGLARLREDGVRVWRSATGELPSEALYTAQATTSPSGERLLWIGSRAGLLRVGDDRVVAYDRRHGLPSDAVRAVKLQRTPEGIDLLWLATEGGIARAALTPTQWRTVSLHGARENGTFGLLLEPDGRGGERLWVGSMQQGLALLQDGQWRYFRQADGTLPSPGVRSLWRVAGPDGTPWRLVGLFGGEVLRIGDDGGFTPMSVPWRKHEDESMVYAGNHGGALWLSTQTAGLHRLQGGAWTHYALPAGDAPGLRWLVYSIAAQTDAQGREWLWAAGDRGLARFDGERWTRVAAPGLPADDLRQALPIVRQGRTELWLASYRHGVLRLDVSDPLAPRRLQGDDVPPAPDATVYSVLPDSRGRIYVCTNNGVQQLSPRADGGYDARVFRRRDGLVHDECNTNSQQIDAHDRYWVGTLGGLSVFDPALRLPRVATVPRPLHFVAARVDGATQRLHDPARLALPAGARELRIDFSLLSGLRESESTYRSRLEGYDPDWTPWSPERRRAFTGLPPGQYELRLEARDYAGTAAAPRSLHIEVAPFWWQRGDVRTLAALLLAAAAASAVLLWNRNLRRRQRELRDQVQARTRELHAANARLTELSYLDPLTGLANRRRLMEAMAAAIEHAAAHRRPLGLIVADVDHFKAYNDRHGHLAGDAALRAVARALQDAMRGHDLVARFGGEEFACLVTEAARQDVGSIAERMRALVEALPPRSIGNDADTLTLSAGWLALVPVRDTTAADLLHAADAALYEAKRAGRNRVQEG